MIPAPGLGATIGRCSKAQRDGQWSSSAKRVKPRLSKGEARRCLPAITSLLPACWDQFVPQTDCRRLVVVTVPTAESERAVLGSISLCTGIGIACPCCDGGLSLHTACLIVSKTLVCIKLCQDSLVNFHFWERKTCQRSAAESSQIQETTLGYETFVHCQCDEVQSNTEQYDEIQSNTEQHKYTKPTSIITCC